MCIVEGEEPSGWDDHIPGSPDPVTPAVGPEDAAAAFLFVATGVSGVAIAAILSAVARAMAC